MSRIGRNEFRGIKMKDKILLISVLIVVIIPYIGWINTHPFSKQSLDFANFIYGTTAPGLTFLSFIAVVLTLRSQREQFDVQNRELKEAKKDMEKQNKTLSVQRFETTFFQMVNLHNQIVELLIYETVPNGKGRNSFRYFYNSLNETYAGKMTINEFRNKDELVKIRESYMDFYNAFESQLGHYFRNLYRIVKFIVEYDTNVLTSHDKKMYIGIIRAQLSSNELALLLYNGLDIENGSKFLPLIYTYNLLDNLDNKKLIKPSHFELFKQEAELWL
jgi:hypothetical protein